MTVTRPPTMADPGIAAEVRRKAIHLAFLVVPLQLLHPILSWPVSRREWTLLLALAFAVAVIIDLVRIHGRRVRRFFARFFGEMIRPHERLGLLGSTYLVLAALLAIDLFPPAIAATAIGYTVLGDGVAGVVGRAWGRRRLFGKSVEGTVAGLAACLAWAAYVSLTGHLDPRVAVTGALVASLVEFLPIPLDDNLGIILFSGYAMRLIWSPL